MKKNILILVIVAIALFQCTNKQGPPPEKPAFAKVEVVVDNYFGTELDDPYRYMEDLTDSSTLDWMKAQSDYSRNLLDRIPGRQSLIDKMAEFDKRKSSRVSPPRITDNDVYFYLKTTPEDETGKLYYRNGFEGEETLLFDPETYNPDDDLQYVISDFNPDHEGLKVAFEVAPNGSENGVLHILNVKTKELFPEKIDRCTNSFGNWLEGNNSFLYLRLNSEDVHDPHRYLNSKTYLHQMGTDPQNDKEMFSRDKYPELEISSADFPALLYDKDINWLLGALFTVDNRWNAYYAPKDELMNDKINWKRLINLEDDVLTINPYYDDLYCLTMKDAQNYKIIKINLSNPDMASAEVIVEEPEDVTIDDFEVTREGIYYSMTKNGVEERLYFLPFGESLAREIELPYPAGRLTLSSRGFKYSDIWVVIMGWTTDFKRYRYDLESNSFIHEQMSDIAEYPEYDNLIVEEVEVASHDGEMVPLSIIYNKGTEMDGSTPLFMMGYGSYGISINPFFSPSFFLWINEGGILAIAHVRGGGEKGDSWHKGGFKTTKPNTWKDLIACAEYLIDNKYTSSNRLVINGGSAGGILVGRAMTERPDLFAAVIPEVGSLNTVRSEEAPGGPANVPEFGTVKDSVECMALIEMDSYHNLKDGTKYPATLVTAGMNDPRVIAWVPAKFAAKLMAANASEEDILFLTDFEAGHGIGNSKTKSWESLADLFSFAFWKTGHKRFQPDGTD